MSQLRRLNAWKIVPRFLVSWVGKIGKWISRPGQSDYIAYIHKQNLFIMAIGLALLTLAGTHYWRPIGKYWSSISSNLPAVPVPRENWHVLLESGPECDQGMCFANPENDALWTAQAFLSDDESHFDRWTPHQGQRIWSGIELTHATMVHAVAQGASVLVLGHLNGTYRIFVNGQLRATGPGTDYIPAEVRLTPTDISLSRLRIAVELQHNLHSGRPFAIGVPFSTGFYTETGARNLRDRWTWLQVICPISLGMLALVASIFFFSLWLSGRENHEYLVFALFCICQLSIQAMLWAGVWLGQDRTITYRLDLWLRLFEGLLGGYVGLSYARARTGIFVGMFVLALAQFGFTQLGARDSGELLIWGQAIAQWWVPLSFALGGFACVAKACMGAEFGYPTMPRNKVPLRITRLAVFGGLMFLIAVIYADQATGILSGKTTVVWHRPVQNLLLAMLGIFLMRDYRDFYRRQRVIHQSRFHDLLAKEQGVFHGFLISIDLKRSSALYDLSASLGMSVKIPTIWCSEAAELIERKGGAILSTDGGDALYAFFYGDQALAQVLEAVVDLEAKSREMTKSLPQPLPMRFRASVVYGGIKPIYRDILGKKREDYEDAPGETTFKDAARIRDEEKKMGMGLETVLVMDQAYLPSVLPEGLTLTKSELLIVRDVGARKLCFLRVGAQVGISTDSAA